MASPRFLVSLLVLLGLVALWECPVRAQKLQGNCENSGTFVDEDDTGLIQSPLNKKKVEVTKVRGIIGHAMNQEGGKAALKHPASPGDPAAGTGAAAMQPQAAAAGTDTKAAPIDAPPKQPPVAAVETASVEKLSAAEDTTAGKAAPKPISSQAAEPAKEGEPAPGTAPQVGLSFFQMSEDENVNTNDKELEVVDEDADKVEEKEVQAETPDESEAPEVQEETEVQAETPDESEAPESERRTTEDYADNMMDKALDDEINRMTDEDASADEQPPTIITPAAASLAEKATATDESPWKLPELSMASLEPSLGQVLVVLVVVALVANLMLRWRSSDRPRDALSAKMRKKLERMQVASGPEIRSVCAVGGGGGDKVQNVSAPMRIQGRVVNKASGPLVAPLSGRSCVLYSASVSQNRHDGVHQPPVAFDSAARDFAVQLEDCPEMLLEINSQDVFPFDMDRGRYACELTFGDAPDTWRSFMLGNLTPGDFAGGGVKGQNMNRVDLGAKGPLNFCECALVVGSRVTCIGEVVREHNGKLRLCPWSPPPNPDEEETTRSRSMTWLTPEVDPWVHKLMVSDDSRLLLEAPLLLPGKCRSCT